MKQYLYFLKTLVPTRMADGSRGPLATLLNIIGSVEECPYWWNYNYLPESAHVGTLQDIWDTVEVVNAERLIIITSDGTDTALVNRFSSLDVLVALPGDIDDFHAIQKSHVTVAAYIGSDADFRCLGDLRRKDFAVIRGFDEGSELHKELKERYGGRVWVYDRVYGWGGDI